MGSAAMTSFEQNDDEVDAKAFKALRDALGPDDFSTLIGECALDLEEASASLDAARTDSERKTHAHKIAGLLSQYACLKAAGLALGIAHEDGVDVAALSPTLASRARICARQLQSLAKEL